MQALFEILLKTTVLQQHFEFIGHTEANRVQDVQTKILHRKSGIECVLQFDTESTFQQSEQATKIISDYMDLHPMCKFRFCLAIYKKKNLKGIYKEISLHA